MSLAQVKLSKSFFDKEAVIAAVGKAEAANISRAAAFVWRRAKTSIRARKKVSPPGKPPSSHRGLLRDLLYFYFDFGTRSAVVGPEKLNAKPKPGRDGTPVGGTVPQSLEFGGSMTVAERKNADGSWTRDRSPKEGDSRPLRFRNVPVGARPFMAPALKAEAPKFPGLWRDSVKP